ncbi:unnamed protein product [Mytilus coruscus]|uniref:Uncharacterized protein n=1 Tax=Mytilus coruscus TaxID=42192 RepID=A0A6J8C9L7_MYTCO|nr:unnamed protein product [Mytilus coruscus]
MPFEDLTTSVQKYLSTSYTFNQNCDYLQIIQLNPSTGTRSNESSYPLHLLAVGQDTILIHRLLMYGKQFAVKTCNHTSSNHMSGKVTCDKYESSPYFIEAGSFHLAKNGVCYIGNIERYKKSTKDHIQSERARVFRKFRTMAEEFIILDPVVENCNVFQDQAIVVKDDGSLQLIHTGAPSSSQDNRLNSDRPVHEEIAKIVNQGAESAVDHKNKEVQELVDKFVRPENCEFLEVPKVNKVLWSSKETSKRLKDNDRSLQRTQGYLVKGMISVVQLMEKSLKSSSEESEETFELSLDSLNLLLYAHRDLSSQRRKLLTPALDKKYLALSHEDEKISPNYLFGDRENLEQWMKEIDDSTKLGNKMKVKSSWNRDKAHVPEVKETYSRHDNFKSDNGSFKGKSGFKNNFLAKKAQIRREQKKPFNKKGKGNLGH